jgi:hypothetical protein
VAVAEADGIQTLQVVQAVRVEVPNVDLLIRQVDQELQVKEITVLRALVLQEMQVVAEVVPAVQAHKVQVVLVVQVVQVWHHRYQVLQ